MSAVPATNPTRRRPKPRKVRLDPAEIGDPTALLALLVDAHLHAAETESPSQDQMRTVATIFNMQVASDDVEPDGQPVNEFGHLVGSAVRATEAYRSWEGPVPLSSLQRVLAGRIDWDPPDALDASVVLDRFACATVTGADATVAEILRWAFEKNRFVSESAWQIEGLATVIRPSSRSLQRFEHAPGLTAKYLSTPGPEEEPPADPTAPFTGLYALGRRRVHELVFDESPNRPRPQVLPKHPAILLSVSYALEYLIIWDRRDAEVPDELIDRRRGPWLRLSMPAAVRLDPEALMNASEQLCGRMGESYPWLLRSLPGWVADLDRDGGDES